MDINNYIFIVLFIILFLFNENKVIKRLILIYLNLFILYNLYKCFFKKVIEGADDIGEPIDYNKNIYNILNDNILLLQDINALKQYEKKLKEDITTIQNNLKTHLTNNNLTNCTADNPLTDDDSTKIATTSFVKSIIPKRWTIKYTEILTKSNGFFFGPKKAYRINNTKDDGSGTLSITNLTGKTIFLQSVGILTDFNNANAATSFGIKPTSVINNGSVDFGGFSIYNQTSICNINTTLYDTINDRCFNIHIYYPTKFRPVIDIEQII